MKRILFVDHAHFLGGAQTVAADHIAALDRVQFTPHVVCTDVLGSVAERYRQAGAEVHELPMRRLRVASPLVPWQLLHDSGRLRRLIRDVRADLVVANTSRTAYLASAAIQGTGVPLVWWVHDLFYNRRLFRSLERVPRAIIFVSRTAEDFYSVRDRERARTIHAGSALHRQLAHVSSGRIVEERRRWGLTPDDIVIGFMGRLVEEKGPEDLLEALDTVRSEFPGLKLLLVGTGRDQPGDVEGVLRQRIRDAGLEGTVVLTGFQPDEALYYSLFDLCVLSSRAPESFGMTLVHAMMAGKPVIGTAVGGPAEMIEHGRTGLLVPPRSPAALARALRELLADPGRARRLAHAGRLHVQEHYRVEQMTARMEEVYAALSGGGMSTAARRNGARGVARNASFNIIGAVVPMAVAVLAIPYLVRGLGSERFGLLSLTWLVIGYFGLFDLGLSRALAQLVAERLGARRESEVPTVVWTGLVLALLFSLLGSLTLALVAPWLVRSVLHVEASLYAEAVRCFRIIAGVLPFVIGTSALAGLLEAKERFDFLNALRVPLGILSYVVPLLVLPFSRSLVPVVAVLGAARALGWLAHAVLCARIYPRLLRRIVVQREIIPRLLTVGGWMTVSNLVSPLMTYLDRFLVGGLLSLSAVAYYATPYEVTSRLILPAVAVAGALFPLFAAGYRTDVPGTAALFVRGVVTTGAMMFAISLGLTVFASEGLTLWLGPEFATESTRALQWLALGLFLNGVAQIPFGLLQASARPDLAAKLHLLELPLYATLVVALTKAYGITGTAMAWTARIAVDAIMLQLLACRSLSVGRRLPRIGAWLTAATVALLLARLPATILGKAAFMLVALTGVGLAAWGGVLDESERSVLGARLVQLRNRAAGAFAQGARPTR